MFSNSRRLNSISDFSGATATHRGNRSNPSFCVHHVENRRTKEKESSEVETIEPILKAISMSSTFRTSAKKTAEQEMAKIKTETSEKQIYAIGARETASLAFSL